MKAKERRKSWQTGGMSEQRDEKTWREYRREQAWKLKQQGWKQKDIARALGASQGAVSPGTVRRFGGAADTGQGAEVELPSQARFGGDRTSRGAGGGV